MGGVYQLDEEEIDISDEKGDRVYWLWSSSLERLLVINRISAYVSA